MKNNFNLILIFFSTVLLSQDVGFSDILNPVYPDKNELDFKKTHTINTAKNSTVDINVVIFSRLNSNIEFIHESKTLNNLIFSEVIDVPVEQNTGLDSRTEQFKGDINPYVIRRAPFNIYEIINFCISSLSIKTTYKRWAIDGSKNNFISTYFNRF